MTDPTTPRTRMTREYLCISASSGSPLVPPRASPCVLELLGLARPRAPPAERSVICLGRGRLDPWYRRPHGRPVRELRGDRPLREDDPGPDARGRAGSG